MGLWRLPDYVFITIPTVIPLVGVTLTLDRNGQGYVGIAGGVNLPGGSGKGYGVGWTGDQCRPTPTQTKDFLSGQSVNVGIGLGATWSSPASPGSGDPSRLGLNIQTPGLSYTPLNEPIGSPLPVKW